jgi:Gas vesicle synthesis protein GvpL/GvpF
MDETATYVYCLVGAKSRPVARRPPAGLPRASAPVMIEVSPTLWLVAADVPLGDYGSPALEQALRDMQWVADIAVAHEAVVEFFAGLRGASIIPMKLFTMFSSPARAVAEMRSRRREIQGALRRIAGCEEWGVRILKEPVSPSRGAAAASRASGADFLRAKKRARDEARESVRVAADAAEETFGVLAPIARDVRRRDDAPAGASSPPLVDAAFLVPTARRARFRSAARKAAAACAVAGAALTLSGPWPAYNFVQGRGDRS